MYPVFNYLQKFFEIDKSSHGEHYITVHIIRADPLRLTTTKPLTRSSRRTRRSSAELRPPRKRRPSSRISVHSGRKGERIGCGALFCNGEDIAYVNLTTIHRRTDWMAARETASEYTRTFFYNTLQLGALIEDTASSRTALQANKRKRCKQSSRLPRLEPLHFCEIRCLTKKLKHFEILRPCQTVRIRVFM